MAAKPKTTPAPKAPTSAPKSAQAAHADFHREVSAVAYQLFERRGRQHGHDLEDWIRAEQIVRKQKS